MMTLEEARSAMNMPTATWEELIAAHDAKFYADLAKIGESIARLRESHDALLAAARRVVAIAIDMHSLRRFVDVDDAVKALEAAIAKAERTT
jgi:hypothetical protein